MATGLGVLGMVFMGFVFGPIALIMGLIAVVLAFARRSPASVKVWGIAGLLSGFIACITSPVLWVILGLSVVSANMPEKAENQSTTTTVVSETIMNIPVGTVSATEVPASELVSESIPNVSAPVSDTSPTMAE